MAEILQPPLEHGNEREHRRMLANSVRYLFDGKIRSFGSITLTASQATSTLSDERIGPGSFIGLFPTTANAAGEFGNGTIYVSARTNESATITHANNAQADRTFMYVVLGQ